VYKLAENRVPADLMRRMGSAERLALSSETIDEYDCCGSSDDFSMVSIPHSSDIGPAVVPSTCVDVATRLLLSDMFVVRWRRTVFVRCFTNEVSSGDNYRGTRGLRAFFRVLHDNDQQMYDVIDLYE